MNSDDRETPVDRPLGSLDRPVANLANRGLVRVLTNHVATLDQVRLRTGEIRDALEVTTALPAPDQLDKLARAMRDEADSAIDVAREAEERAKIARAGARG